MKNFCALLGLLFASNGFVFSQATNLLPTTGNVGVGTLTPIHKLEVKDGDLFLNKSAIGGGTIRSFGHFLEFKGANDNNYAHRYYRFYPSPGASGQTYSVLELYFGKTDLTFEKSVNITAAGYTYFNGGNVGIGTASPYYKLEIRDGDLFVNNTMTGNGAIRSNGNFMDFKGVTDNSYSHRTYRFYPSAGSAGQTFTTLELYQGKTDMTFEKRVNITTDGVSYFNGASVGIGTTATGSFKLAVEGKIGAREVVVLAPGAAWPDYVFAPEYKLRTLDEIEQFVKEKQHLPDVPSAEAVANDGVNLGEMNAILLRKVEELTLHLIELKKEVDKLHQENVAIKNEIKAQ